MRQRSFFTSKAKSFFIPDLCFILLIAVYAFACWKGALQMSEHGVILDSDLQTYAQGMAGEAHPELFSRDPVLEDRNPANSIPNLQRMLAGIFLYNDDFAGALLAAGAIAIFVFYAGWYAYGRLVFRFPVLAAMLSLLMGITVWTGWGTFWGVNHSDPVPRVFFGALFPFLLLLAMQALTHPFLRPIAMLASGLGMWVHGISALNCGAMFFTAFFFIKSPGQNTIRHIANLLLCLLAFLMPVLYYLWPSLIQKKIFTNDELILFKELFSLRWQEDYSNFGKRLLDFFSISNPSLLILLGGLFSWFIIFGKGSERLKAISRMFPAFILALALVTAFCWLESRYAPELGRLSMGHELVRGIRFLTPLSWIMITGLLAVCVPRLFWRFSMLLLAVSLLLFTGDRQYVAAQYAISEFGGLSLPLHIQGIKEHDKASSEKKMLDMIKNSVPQGEAIFSDEDLMSIRYLALHPLVHTFKDGYVFYYNKDYPHSAEWLKMEKTLRSAPDAYVDAWLLSSAPWFISRKKDLGRLLAPHAQLVDQAGEWRLYKRNP